LLNLNSILFFSENPKQLADFYQKVLEKEHPDMEDQSGYYGFSAGQAFLSIGPHSEVKGHNPNPQRMMFNFETTDVKGEFERIKGLGAEVIAEPYQPGEMEEEGSIATFADPDGNYFQLMPPWEGEK